MLTLAGRRRRSRCHGGATRLDGEVIRGKQSGRRAAAQPSRPWEGWPARDGVGATTDSRAGTIATRGKRRSPQPVLAVENGTRLRAEDARLACAAARRNGLQRVVWGSVNTSGEARGHERGVVCGLKAVIVRRGTLHFIVILILVIVRRGRCQGLVPAAIADSLKCSDPGEA